MAREDERIGEILPMNDMYMYCQKKKTRRFLLIFVSLHLLFSGSSLVVAFSGTEHQCNVKKKKVVQTRPAHHFRSLDSIPVLFSEQKRIHVKSQTFELSMSTTPSKVDTENNGNNNNNKLLDNFQIKKRETLGLIQNNKLRWALQSIREVVAMAENLHENNNNNNNNNNGDNDNINEQVDQLLQAFTSRTFTPPYQRNAARNRIMLGMEAISLQLSSRLVPPYNTVPKRVFLNALRALTGLNEVQQQQQQQQYQRRRTPAIKGMSSSLDSNSTFSAFRILQRLVTGVGIRKQQTNKKYNSNGIQEKDFNMVLNSFSNIGQMDMAHKIVALQERTKNAPPLSPVAYSILLKGYGRLGDLRNVDMIIEHAKADGIVPDTVMINSLIDAYVNCNAIEKAKDIFCFMTKGDMSEDGGSSTETINWIKNEGTLSSQLPPKANRRTYNTMLKGFANRGSLKECLALSQFMQKNDLWDDVTTNTLVHAAVVKQDFALAETILIRHTSRSVVDQKQRGHPNVEAYTELLDGYSKNGDLDRAVSTLQTMKHRHVEPNEVTYTCLVAAFARHGKVEEGKKMIHYMEAEAGLKPTVVTYNALISALVVTPDQTDVSRRDRPTNDDPISTSPTDKHVDEALRAFYSMMKSGIRPNDVTISVLVLALGGCRPTSRYIEAKELVAKLENNGIVNLEKNARVATALINACGLGGDMPGALETFRNLRKPDLLAVNTFLSACFRCNNEQIAMKTFRHFFGNRNDSSGLWLMPDVVTFSVMICGLLRKNTLDCSKEADELYHEMKDSRDISPDKPMVDLILRTIIRTGKLLRKDVPLVASIIRDAEKLMWRPGQLESRKRAIQNVMSSRSNVLKIWTDDDDDILRREIISEDALFKRKGWNEVDSGFRLWGGGRMGITTNKENNKAVVDEFLQKKGWNDVDSGFRVI